MTAAAQRSQEEAHLHQQSIQESQAYNEKKHKETKKVSPIHSYIELFCFWGKAIVSCNVPHHQVQSGI